MGTGAPGGTSLALLYLLIFLQKVGREEKSRLASCALLCLSQDLEGREGVARAAAYRCISCCSPIQHAHLISRQHTPSSEEEPKALRGSNWPKGTCPADTGPS